MSDNVQISPAEQFLKSKGIERHNTSLICYIDGAMRQPDLYELLEEYSKVKIKAAAETLKSFGIRNIAEI